MKNAHTREIAAPIEKIRPWIEAGWTGTANDPFPRDILRTWRKNPPGTDRGALIPEVTRLGHGPFSFRFVSWDGDQWRVRVESAGFNGWHGFDLAPTPHGCQVTHIIELKLSGPARVVWPLCIAPIHDWAVESILDRIEAALATGAMPEVTSRAMPWPASAWFRVLTATLPWRRRRAERARTGAP